MLGRTKLSLASASWHQHGLRLCRGQNHLSHFCLRCGRRSGCGNVPTSISNFARKTSNTYMTTILVISILVFASFTLMWCTFRTKPNMPKEAHAKVVTHSKPSLESYFKSTSLCPRAESGEIEAMFTAIRLWSWHSDEHVRTGWASYGFAVSLGRSRYRDEIRVEKWTLHNPNFLGSLLPSLKQVG